MFQTPPDRIAPDPDQESVWDYPRPPRVEPVRERVRVVIDGISVADSTHAMRVIETGGAPVYYVPPSDVLTDLLLPASRQTVCEFKGVASYWSIGLPGRAIEDAVWSYDNPNQGFESIRGHFAFYAWLVDEAWVGAERAAPQPGRYFGGWVTSRVVGPFKGDTPK